MLAAWIYMKPVLLAFTGAMVVGAAVSLLADKYHKWKGNKHGG